MTCKICGNEHEGRQCNLIKAYEYYPVLDVYGNAIVKRVEFVSIADFVKREAEPAADVLPAHPTRQ